jgi:hypothetical protein
VLREPAPPIDTQTQGRGVERAALVYVVLSCAIAVVAAISLLGPCWETFVLGLQAFCFLDVPLLVILIFARLMVLLARRQHAWHRDATLWMLVAGLAAMLLLDFYMLSKQWDWTDKCGLDP